jgi:putative ABC transport system permease protein
MIPHLRRACARLRAVFSSRALDADFEEEVAHHIEAATADNIRAGMTPAEARRRARMALGGLDAVRELHRDTRGLPWLEDVGRDVRVAVRMLRKSPGFTGVTVLILALGIGGVTAMFGTLHAVLIRPLPYPRPDRLVLGRATVGGYVNPWLSGPDYADYRDRSRSFAALETFFANPFEVTVDSGHRAYRADTLIVSTGLFPSLGLKMTLGRAFTADEGRDGAPPVVIVSHALWERLFGPQTEIRGRAIVIDGVAREVVGVTPPGFHFIYDVDVWLPLRPQGLGPRRYNNWYILGRLKDGTTLAEAQSDVDVIAARLEQAYPDTNAEKGLLLTPLQAAFAERYRTSFGLLGGGTAAILLIACANAAGLLLARGAGRTEELAVRAAIGASGWRLMRLVLTEALLLAGAAGVAGTVVAVGMQRGLLRLMPIEAVLLRDVGLSLPVLLFVPGVTVLAGVGFGLFPAWRARHLDLAQDLRTGGHGTRRDAVVLRGGLVIGQVTVSFVLLVVAGLLVRTLASLHAADLGFRPGNLLTAGVPLPPAAYPEPKRTLFFSSLLERVRSLPGVVSAGAISQLPLRDPYNNVGIYAASAPPVNPGEGGDGYQRIVMPGYFGTMGIPILAGRDIRPTDSAESRRVVVVSRQLARSLFPGRDPLGELVIIDRAAEATWEIVGVVGDVRQSGLREEPDSRGTFYRAHAQQASPTMRLAIRTAGDPQAMLPSLRKLLRELDPRVPLSGPRTMEDVIANSSVSEKAQAVCLTTFSALALTLAAVGIYGLLAYVVTQRQRETAIRVALGATRWQVAWPILREAGVLTLGGVAIGGAGAVGATRLIRASLYGVAPGDPTAFAGAAMALVLVAGLAAGLPAHRAVRADPVVALRAQ